MIAKSTKVVLRDALGVNSVEQGGGQGNNGQ